MGFCVGMDVGGIEGACDGRTVGHLDGSDVSGLVGGTDGIAVIEGSRVGTAVCKLTETSDTVCAEIPEKIDATEIGAASAIAASMLVVLIADST